MFKKELHDTLKASAVAVLVFAAVIVFSYTGIQLGSKFSVPLNELICFSIETVLLLIALYLGSGVFSEEKVNNSFEYLFSLKFTRMQVFFNKMLPRFLAMSAFFVLYLLFRAVLAGHPLPLRPVFIPLYFSIFLFSAAMSLMHRDNVLTLVYNFLGFGFLLGMTILVVSIFLQSFNHTPGDMWISTIRIPIAIVTVISAVFFIVFSISFRRTDLSNMSFLVKKHIARIGIALGAIVLLFVVINLFDAGANPDAYTVKDLPGATFAKTNGFYRLWTLAEPPGTDIESDEVTDRYRRLFDPEFDNKKYIREFDHAAYRMGAMWHLLNVRVDWPPIKKDWKAHLISQKKAIEKAKTEGGFFLDRYQKLIDSEVFEDFTSFTITAHHPNLLVWLRTAKTYAAGKALEAVEGNWEPAVNDLLRQIDFCKKAVKGSRILITNLIAKAVMKDALYTLAFLMNLEECPGEVFRRVLEGLPPITYEEFGNRKCLIAEYLMWDTFIEKEIYGAYDGKLEHVFMTLFMQKNRTKKYYFDMIKELVDFEATPPYKWTLDPAGRSREVDKSIASGWFWWLHNPVGKIVYMNTWAPNFRVAVMKSYYLKTVYDMTRISAELHLKYTPGKPVEEMLKGLETYRTLIDPCSGKPYTWDGKKQVLYSPGTDRDDDGAKDFRVTSWDADFVLPVVLHDK